MNRAATCEEHGDYGVGHDPLLPSSFHFVGAAGYLGVRPTAPTLTSGASGG
jgi:hypothetical protein